MLSPSLRGPPVQGDPALGALRARTQLWFQQTQVGRLRAEGELPPWFHGFISRREAEQLLQDEPLGCFLVRFSESTVGFVLSYRGRDRCRHFVLAQDPDGKYVILGERSAHTELRDLLQHYSTAPIAPFHEVLTVPRAREDEPHGTDAARFPWRGAPGMFPVYSTVSKGPRGARQEATAPLLPVEPGAEGCSAREAPGVPPPLPAKASSKEHEEATYQQLLSCHLYAEPHEGTAPGPTAHREQEEPGPFYAMGRGCSENIYSEVVVAGQDLPPRPPRSPPGRHSRRRQLPAAPTTAGGESGAPGAAPRVGSGRRSLQSHPLLPVPRPGAAGLGFAPQRGGSGRRGVLSRPRGPAQPWEGEGPM